MNEAAQTNPRLPRRTAVVIFGIFGALCGGVVCAFVLKGLCDWLTSSLLAGVCAAFTARYLYNDAQFDKVDLAIIYGGLIGLISHLPLTLLFTVLFPIFSNGHLPQLEQFFVLAIMTFIAGIVVAGPFEFAFGALAGLVIHHLSKPRL